jgi:hypothetical protein
MTTTPAELAGLLTRPGPGTDRHLSDLLAHHASTGGPVFVTDSVLRHAGADDPVLYTAHRDVLPPRRACGTEWFADLVIYQPGDLPGGELNRSTGHWNSPSQLEVFQTLSGRTLMITAWRDGGQPVLRYQACEPGTLATVPFGAWHLTLVLDGPAEVFNLYTDLPAPGADPHGTASPPTKRRAAAREQAKYRRGPAVEITATRSGSGFSLTGSARGLAAWGPGQHAGEPSWLRSIIGDEPLAAFYATASPHTLTRLSDQARASLPANSRSEHR